MDMYGLGTCAGNTVVLGAVCYTQGRLSLQLSVADAQINDFLNVSLTHTECRLTGGVCSLDTAGTAGGNAGVTGAHHQVGCLSAGVLFADALNQVSRSTYGFKRLSQQLNHLHRQPHGHGVRRDNHGVAALQCHHGVADDGGHRVGAGHNAADYAHGLVENLDAGLQRAVFIVHSVLALANSPLAEDNALQFGHLIVYVAHLGLVESISAEFLCIFASLHTDGAKHFVHTAVGGKLAFKLFLCYLALGIQALHILFQLFGSDDLIFAHGFTSFRKNLYFL